MRSTHREATAAFRYVHWMDRNCSRNVKDYRPICRTDLTGVEGRSGRCIETREPSMLMHPASCAVTRLELFFYETSLGHATGFLYTNAGELCLISNWHVFSGKHAVTLKVMNKDGMTPTRVEFHWTCASLRDTGVEYQFVPVKADLIKDGVGLWWQHGGYLDGLGVPRIVDVGILPLGAYLNGIDPEKVQSFENQVLVQQDRVLRRGVARGEPPRSPAWAGTVRLPSSAVRRWDHRRSARCFPASCSGSAGRSIRRSAP